ncbi:hypothetical protein BT96DRAFT_944495 [Gymnopus androsaceus JB14]|uniref:Uncharacterized protein n=1 Tax=Gymnopus androsaceus JB14 TaxID=1447944 RepID=A0A6A4H348_9AGAR|nr:hypothetical protein BT96DRAFT_944495 [Gymnopus androsaceus JB14]
MTISIDIAYFWGVVISTMLYAYLQRITDPNPSVPYLEDLSLPLAIITGICFTVAAILTDGLTIYRLFMIWNRNVWICIAPTFTLIGMNCMRFRDVCSNGRGRRKYQVVWNYFRIVRLSLSSVAARLMRMNPYSWLITTFVVGICTNFTALVTATGLVVYKLLSNNRATATGGTSHVKLVMAIMIESTVLYSCVFRIFPITILPTILDGLGADIDDSYMYLVESSRSSLIGVRFHPFAIDTLVSFLPSGTKLINLLVLVSQSNVAYIFFCMVIPIIGIASNLLIIHVGYEKYFKDLASSRGTLSNIATGNGNINTSNASTSSALAHALIALL